MYQEWTQEKSLSTYEDLEFSGSVKLAYLWQACTKGSVLGDNLTSEFSCHSLPMTSTDCSPALSKNLIESDNLSYNALRAGNIRE